MDSKNSERNQHLQLVQSNSISKASEMKLQEKNHHYSIALSVKPEKQSIEIAKIGVLSRILLTWSHFFIKPCHQRIIAENEIIDIQQSQPFKRTFERWNKFWAQSEFFEQFSQKSGKRLKWTIRKTFENELIAATIMSFISHQSNALAPLIVYFISEYINLRQFTYQKSIMFIVLIFGLKIVKIFLAMHSEFILKKVGNNIFACICCSMGDKSLTKIKKTSSAELSISQISKLAQYDCSKLVAYPNILQAAYLQFYSFLFSMGCLCYIAGWQGFVSCVVLLVLQMVRYIMMGFFKEHQKKMSEETSKRITASTQIVNNMKFIKVNALQFVFFEKLRKMRENEVKFLQKYLNLGIMVTVLQSGASRICIVIFIVLQCVSGREIYSTLIFSVILFFHFMALHKIMNKANNLEDIGISLVKIQAYLRRQPRNNSYITHNLSNESSEAISITNGNFFWEKRQITNSEKKNQHPCFRINNLQLQIKKGQFIAFVGEYGSGKSSIINAILGQMNSEQSTLKINGKIAYASQNPWIFNDTVKQNILFGEPFEQQRYKKALHFSCLEPDLKLFSNGEQTVIGQRGSTLSGGQRARISIARALYKQADIYILDDVLSALDAHVSGFIFKETFARFLKGKTVLLATHLVNYLDYVDRAFVVEEGNLSEVKIIKREIKELVKDQQFTIDEESLTLKQTPKQKQISSNISQQQLSDLELFKIYLGKRGGALCVIVLVLMMLFQIASSMLLFIWLNSWMKAQRKYDGFYYGVYLAFVAANSISIGIHCFVEYNSKFFTRLHRAMVLNLLIAPMAYFETTSISNTMNKLSTDLKKIDAEVVPQFRNAVYFVSLGLSFVSNSIYIYIKKDQPFMIAAVTVLILLITYFYYYFIVAMRQVHRLQQQSMISVFSTQVEMMVGAPTIRAYQQQDYMKQKQFNAVEKFMTTAKIMAGINSYSAFIISLITTVVTTGLLVNILIVDQFQADFFLIYNIFSFERTVQNLQTVLSDFLSSLKYLGYCEELMKIPREEGYALLTDGKEEEFKSKVDSKWVQEGRIDFENYSVRYRPQTENIIKELALSLKPRQKLGVVGRTGSGKSTTILGLLRILQSHEGTIKIDGSDIYQLDLQTVRAGFSVILQEHFLFSGTVRDNIDPRRQFQDNQIIKALQSCGLWQSIRGRNGLQTQIEQGGGNFSAGEKQLMNISRTLLNPKKIVLVDEATASIDFQSDQMLQKVIKQQLSQSTIITIAHRIDTILSSDRIMVLDKGRIVEIDSPQKLLEKPSIFSELYREFQNKNRGETDDEKKASVQQV